MVKEELKILKKDLETNSISLTKFLFNYCGIYNRDIYKIKISHQDVKKLMPQIKRISFEDLLINKDGIYTGEVIPVKDCYGSVVPYINPMLNIEITSEIYCKGEEKTKLENIVLDESLSDYELVKLMRFFKDNDKKKEYRQANNLLKLRKDKNQKKKVYKREKQLIMKGSYLND